MHRSWKKRAVKELVQSPTGNYLDVCCGTGDLALTVAKYLSAQGSVTGLDFSANMLDVARSRAKNLQSSQSQNGNSAKIEFQQGDAQKLPFAAESFDGAIISFGLRNLTDLQAGLNEMARVVKPGGRVVNLDLGHPTNPIFAPMFGLFFGHVVPIIGEVLQNDRQAYTYLPESRNTYPKPNAITKMFEQAGLTNVQHIPLAFDSVALHVGTRR
jgi:demethylmenaquinone methyltransferase/2-methoxy-6-polyprenyl-1,4-benzoquinol methylase